MAVSVTLAAVAFVGVRLMQHQPLWPRRSTDVATRSTASARDGDEMMRDTMLPADRSTVRPIAAEAQVFRTTMDMLSIGAATGPRRPAHPRSLARYRSLRAYPGAPPRIPHGLTATEYRETACRGCHERGGFSARFEAYVPVTPHPELGACLQCHVGNAVLMAIPLPTADPSSRCRQCHVPGGPRASTGSIDWRTTAWPQVAHVTAGRNPPPIPHDSPMRTNCLSCHASPSGVAEIQTTHPERANCRQCHVQSSASAP